MNGLEAVAGRIQWDLEILSVQISRETARDLARAALEAAAANVGNEEVAAVARYAGDDYKGMVEAALKKMAEG